MLSMKKEIQDLHNQIHDIKTEHDQAQQSFKRTIKTSLKKAEVLRERGRSGTIGTKNVLGLLAPTTRVTSYTKLHPLLSEVPPLL